jgi:hypothetical protein
MVTLLTPGTPFTCRSVTFEEDDVPPQPVLTMNSVVVELNDWTGCTEARFGLAEKV